MAKWFNIGGPCRADDNYMLSATERLPNVVDLINKKQYFVVHAPRQCGKTTAFQALADEINAKGEMVAYYAKSHEKAYRQLAGYMDTLGVAEGWLVVADSDLTKPWEEKIATETFDFEGKTIHLVRC